MQQGLLLEQKIVRQCFCPATSVSNTCPHSDSQSPLRSGSLQPVLLRKQLDSTSITDGMREGKSKFVTPGEMLLLVQEKTSLQLITKNTGEKHSLFSSHHF